MNGGTGKGGMTQAATEALGKLLHHDNDDATKGRPGPRQRLFVVVLLVLVLAGWGVWELIA